VICHPTIKAIIDQRIGNVNPSSEDLIQVTTQLMGDGVHAESSGEFQKVELSIHVVYVVVEVTTHHYRCIGILSDDILDDIGHPFCSLFLMLLLSRFEVAV